MLKHKEEVFKKFIEWKTMVEKTSGHKVKVLRTDNGGANYHRRSIRVDTTGWAR